MTDWIPTHNPPYERGAKLFHGRVVTSKLVRSIQGLRGASHRWLTWANGHQRHGTTVWVHAPSVGEALVAEPILRRLRSSLGPDLTIVHTHTSPSVQNWPNGWTADRTDYLPPPGALRAVCRVLNPALIMYPRGELWPHLVYACHGVGARQVVVAGRIREGSRRTRWPIRNVMTKLARHISLSTVCSRQEAPRWCDLGFDAATVIVTGDPRDDYVVERALDLTALEPLRVWAQGKRLMIAGSTHPADERCLLEALNGQSSRDALVLVPHESHPTRTRALLEAARDSNVAARVWREGAPVPECRALVITRPGMLQDLYALADIAFVGGGFDQSGVHSMAEAAAFAVPIIVGAHGTRSMECRRFLTATGATVVSDARHLAAIWRAWSEQPDVRARIGLAARRGLTAGASSRTVAYLLDMLAGR